MNELNSLCSNKKSGRKFVFCTRLSDDRGDFRNRLLEGTGESIEKNIDTFFIFSKITSLCTCHFFFEMSKYNEVQGTNQFCSDDTIRADAEKYKSNHIIRLIHHPEYDKSKNYVLFYFGDETLSMVIPNVENSKFDMQVILTEFRPIIKSLGIDVRDNLQYICMISPHYSLSVDTPSDLMSAYKKGQIDAKHINKTYVSCDLNARIHMLRINVTVDLRL